MKDAYGGAHQVDVEIAATSASRTRGLMWRESLTDGTGMLFIFPREQVQSFWMANTLISLDMIFINNQKRIVGIVQQAQPQTTTSRSVGQPSLYVLEVPGGWAEKNGISPTGEVELQGTSMIAAE